MKKRYLKILGDSRGGLLSVGMLLISWSLLAQQTTINGKATNVNGEILSGVSVLVKHTDQATQTDMNGQYRIQATPGAVLVFKSLGFVTQEISIGESNTIDVQLAVESKSLDEIVVSYGRQRNREVTGSIAQINASDLSDMPVGQFAQQLQGKVAGVQISQSSGQPGRGMSFRIRGAASLFAGSEPLFVVDGIPVTGSINNINPSEIETFTVLKDASATSLYGSRAANGVILITTKHAKPGENKIEFSSYYGIQAIPQNRVPEMMNAREFAEFYNELYEDRIRYEGFMGSVPEVYQNPERYGEGTNWYNVLTQTAPIQSYDLTVSSASERSSTTVIGGYQEQEGVIINTGTKLFSLRLNQSFNFNDNKLKAGFSLAPSYRIDHNNRLGTDGSGGLFNMAVQASPLVAPVNPDGTLPLNVNTAGMVNNINPYAQLTQIKDDYKTLRMLGNAYLDYEITSGLRIKTHLAVDKGGETRNRFSPSTVSSIGETMGLSSSVDNYSWTSETNIQYNKTFNDNHDVEALLGYSAQKFEAESNGLEGRGFPSDDVEWLSAATSITSGTSNTTQYSLLSTIARLNYNYKGKYLMSGAVRRDGSSRFGQDRKYGYFPSVSVGWVMSDEDFMNTVEAVNLLKIRASYGITGNNDIGNFTHISSLSGYNHPFGGVLVPGTTVSSLGNAELAWERNKQFNIGLDLSLFDSRVSLTYDYYQKLSDGMIQDRRIPRASGFQTIKYNVGEFEFWGHEIGVNTNYSIGAVKWNANLNVSFDRNQIKSLVDPGFIDASTSVVNNYYRHQVGRRIGEFYGFVFDGLYKDEEDLANSAKYGSSSKVGTIKMKDINGDGVIDNVSDRTFIGDPTPDFLFGFTNNFVYKNFDLNISMAGSVGGQILNVVKWTHLLNMDGARLLLKDAKNRWRSEENPGTGIYPRTYTGTTAIGRSVNSQWLENGSYLSFKNISLGYTVGLKNTSTLKNLRVYGSVQNAFVITNYSGMNPEINASGLDATRGIGVDSQAYPVARVFSLGFSTSF